MNDYKDLTEDAVEAAFYNDLSDKAEADYRNILKMD